MATKLFLVALDRQTAETQVIDLGFDTDAAMHEGQARERELHARAGNLEVVLLASDSEETLRRTHSSFFPDEIDLSDFLPASVRS